MSKAQEQIVNDHDLIRALRAIHNIRGHLAEYHRDDYRATIVHALAATGMIDQARLFAKYIKWTRAHVNALIAIAKCTRDLHDFDIAYQYALAVYEKCNRSCNDVSDLVAVFKAMIESGYIKEMYQRVEACRFGDSYHLYVLFEAVLARRAYRIARGLAGRINPPFGSADRMRAFTTLAAKTRAQEDIREARRSIPSYGHPAIYIAELFLVSHNPRDLTNARRRVAGREDHARRANEFIYIYLAKRHKPID